MDIQNDNHDLKEFDWMMVLLQNIDVGIIVLDRNYHVQVWNTFMENHSGIKPQTIRNKKLFEMCPEIPEDWFKRKCEAVFQLKHHSFNTWQEKPYLLKYKNYRPITNPEKYMYQNFTIFPITTSSGEAEHIAIVIYDATDVVLSKKELLKTNQALKQQSRTDQLTLLFNRGYWEFRLQQEFDRFMRYRNVSTLIMLDIDHFKKINDTYGHPAGDEVIRYLATTIEKLKRNTDIAGRYGGEEFSILLVDTNSEQAGIFAQRLLETIESSVIHFQGTPLRVTISIGLAEFSESDDNYEKILSRADEALYVSKGNGRNQFTVFNEEKMVEPASEINYTSG